MSKWIGYAVSVTCGEPLGCYQGTILAADGSTLTLSKAFRNGFPYPKSQVTLNAADIKELKIIEARGEPAEHAHSTVAVSKAKKGQRATVCETLQANPSSPSSAGGAARSKPVDIARPARAGAQAGSYGTASSTPRARGAGTGAGAAGGAHDKARRRNEACFGDAADPALDNDFDFEGNLALFDKRALWEQMNNAHKPDLVRQTDGAAKFRHDENVLGAAPAPRRAIRVPDDLRGPLDYVTDDGVCVPSVTPHLRRQLWEGLHRYGLAECAHTLLARAAADVALRLVGGGRRLDPRNAHQTPTAVALVGAHRAGAAGLTAARLLQSHGVRVAAHVAGAGAGAECGALRRELAALALGGVAAAPAPDRLPNADLVLLALHDPRLGADEDAEAAPSRLRAALEWARAARGAVVALEPPPVGWDVPARAAIVALLPPALAPSLGRAYLADVAPPARLFADLRLAYHPPFGAASVLALHPADD